MTTKSAKHVWQAALGELQLQVTRANYNTWLKHTVGVSYDDGLFVIGAPSTFATEWLEKRLRSLIRKTLIGITGQLLEVRFLVCQPQGEEAEKALQAAGQATSPGNPQASLPDNGRFASTKLNHKYTFSSFIVGSSNRLAHAAASGVAENPGRGYNPLFIYGGVGLGKTHLLHAVGHLALERNHQVLYVSSEQFTNEFINAIRERKNEEFRNKYRSIEVLLMDDIQFIAGKEQTQEEFFHTFNDLHGAGRQIVISSDRSPKSMPLLEDRLRSRFEWGLIADIQPPDLETRLAILRAKAEEQGPTVPPEILDFIAHKVQSNIRELEGTLNRIIALGRLGKTKLTLEVAARALEELSTRSHRRRNITPVQILNVVAAFYSLGPEELRGKRRDKEIALARQVAMYLIREETQRSFAEIGQVLGGRDHSTVLHGCGKISNEINVNNQLRREVLQLRESLYSKKD